MGITESWEVRPVLQTLGASPLLIYWRVILPAIIPESFSSVFLTLGLAWSAVIGAEYVGVESGIGRMTICAEFFSHTGRIVLVTIFIVLYSTLSWIVMRSIARRILAWMPKAHGQINPLN